MSNDAEILTLGRQLASIELYAKQAAENTQALDKQLRRLRAKVSRLADILADVVSVLEETPAELAGDVDDMDEAKVLAFIDRASAMAERFQARRGH